MCFYLCVKVFLLVRHDVEHHVVGGIHGLLANRREVVYALVDIVVDDALGRGDLMVLHGEQRGKESGGHARANLYAAGGLGPVANHAGEIGDHVLYGGAHAAVVASHEINYATTRARACHDTATECRQRAKVAVKAVGRSAAAMMVDGGVVEVFATYISLQAFDTMTSAGVKVSFSKKLEHREFLEVWRKLGE